MFISYLIYPPFEDAEPMKFLKRLLLGIFIFLAPFFLMELNCKPVGLVPYSHQKIQALHIIIKKVGGFYTVYINFVNFTFFPAFCNRNPFSLT